MTARKPQLCVLWGADIGEHVIALAWSAGGAPLLAAAAVGGPITVLSRDGAVRASLPGHGFGTAALAWHPALPLLASAGQDGQVRVWECPTHDPAADGCATSGGERLTLPGGAAWVERVAWRPDGALLASAAGRKLRVWAADGALIREWSDFPSTIADLAWLAPAFLPPGVGNGEPVLVAAAYGGLSLWLPDRDAPLARFEWKGSSLALAASPDGRYLATGDQDASAHFWMVESGEDLQMFGYPTKVRELSWDASSRFLATGGGPAVTVWDCGGAGPEGARPRVLDWHTNYVSAVAFQRRGPLLASGGLDFQLALWRVGRSSKRPLATAAMSESVTQLAWSPDDACLAAGDAGGGVQVFGVTG
jgi:WD40 repeat protein